jgi:4-hydroxy-tetrahydrodipicolinate synthase
MASHKKELAGVISAPLIPLSEKGKLDLATLQKQISYLIESGINGLFVNGTTGEGAYLTLEEKLAILRTVKEVAAGRVFLCAACIQPSTPQVLTELDEVLKIEPDFVVAVSPYYYSLPQDAILRHFREIARRSSVPLIAYNIPQCTHNPLSFDTIQGLAHEENIAGIKDSSGDFVSFGRGLSADFPSHFSWIMGEDYLDGAALLMGARGIVSGLSNVWARYHVELYNAVRAGDKAGALRNNALIHELYGIHRVTGGKVIPALKAGAAFFSRCTPWMKIPGLELSEHETSQVRLVLNGLHLL